VPMGQNSIKVPESSETISKPNRQGVSPAGVPYITCCNNAGRESKKAAMPITPQVNPQELFSLFIISGMFFHVLRAHSGEVTRCHSKISHNRRCAIILVVKTAQYLYLNRILWGRVGMVDYNRAVDAGFDSPFGWHMSNPSLVHASRDASRVAIKAVP